MALPDENEPGLDLHDWETRYEQLEEDLGDDPTSALPDLADLVEDMLAERDADPSDPVLRAADDREPVVDYATARETADRIERGDDVDPGDVASAVNALREAYALLVDDRRAI